MTNVISVNELNFEDLVLNSQEKVVGYLNAKLDASKQASNFRRV